MAVYPGVGAGSAIGSLLRMITEQRSQTPISTAQAENQGAIRDSMTGAVKGPESPGSSRIVGIKPEGITASPTSSAGTVVAPRAAIGQYAIGGDDVGNVVAPVNPVQRLETGVAIPGTEGVAPGRAQEGQTQQMGTPKEAASSATISRVTAPTAPLPPTPSAGTLSLNQATNDKYNKEQADLANMNAYDATTTAKLIGLPWDSNPKQAAKIAGQVLGTTITKSTPAKAAATAKAAAPAKSNPLGFLTQSPFAYLATRIFGR